MVTGACMGAVLLGLVAMTSSRVVNRSTSLEEVVSSSLPHPPPPLPSFLSFSRRGNEVEWCVGIPTTREWLNQHTLPPDPFDLPSKIIPSSPLPAFALPNGLGLTTGNGRPGI